MLWGGDFEEWFGHASGAVGDDAVGDVIEEGGELIEVSLGDRVIFVIVAAGALDGECEEDGGGGVDAVGDVFGVIFGFDDATFSGEDVIAIEAGGDFLAESGIGEEVSGELFGEELVPGHVVEEGVDDPVAPGPHGASFVVVVAICVGVAGEVEPVCGESFCGGGRGEELVDSFFAGGGERGLVDIFEESGDFCGGRW